MPCLISRISHNYLESFAKLFQHNFSIVKEGNNYVYKNILTKPSYLRNFANHSALLV